MRDLRLLPKAHLHTHLESTVRPETIRDLGGVSLAEDRPFTSFREFADQRAAVRALLRDRQDFRRIAEEFCQDEAAQGVRYAEVTFTAAAHGERLNDLEMPLEAVLEGLAAGAERYGIQTRVILDHSRRRPPERLWRTLEVLTVGQAARIGHGIRALEDPRLVAELRSRQVPLEVCPTSNVLLGLVPALAAHPLPRLVEAGLMVTLNTDGETRLAAEYERAREVFGYTDTELASLARASVEAAFAPAELKAQIGAAIGQWLRS